MHDSLSAGKILHSQPIKTLLSAYNEQLTANEASPDRTSGNKQKRENCPYDQDKVLQVSRILGKPFRQELVQESTSGNALLTKSSDTCELKIERKI
jgi:hypothetical protein